MPKYYELLLAETIPADAHPMAAKKELGRRIVARFHSEADAQHALDDFNTRFSQKDLSSADLPLFALPAEKDIVSVVVAAFASLGAQRSRSDARRLVEQGSVQWNGEKITDPKAALPADAAGILKLDKTRAVRAVRVG
jgi:tyrosyl-tRNA synthetase